MEFPYYVSSFTTKYTNERRFICNVCDKYHNYYSTVEILRHLKSPYHKKRMETLNAFYCKTCDRQFYFNSTWNAHINGIRHKEKLEAPNNPFYCNICETQCMNKSTYDRHIKTKKHKKKEDPSLRTPLNCDVCQMEFLSRIDKERHLQTKKHLNKLNPQPKIELKCDVCFIKFNSKSSEQKHLLTKKHQKNDLSSPVRVP